MSEIARSENLVAFVEKMPAFPKSVQRVIQLTSNLNTPAKEIVQVIESDPVMTVKILKAINSAYYGLPKKITSVQRAVIHIGLNTIKNMALSIAAIGVLNSKNKAGFDAQQFLMHSLTTASLSRMLAEKLDVPAAESSDFFVAGLLHDFGKIVFAEYCPELFAQALQISLIENVSLNLCEREIIGMDHADAGQILAEKWQLDPLLVRAIDHHSFDGESAIIKDCVFVANQVSKKMEFGFAGNPFIEPFPESVLSRFGMELEGLIEALGDLSFVHAEAFSFISS